MIYLINVNDTDFVDEISNQQYKLKKDVYFFDWVPPFNIKTSKHIESQLKILNSLNDDIPCIIFDRYCSITDKEFLNLNDRNIVFMEPAVNHRNGFIYSPYWLKLKEFNTFDFNTNRKFITGFKKRNMNNSVGMLLIDLQKKGITNIGIDAYINKEHFEVYQKFFTIDKIEYNEFSTLVISDNKYNREKGVIPDITEMYNNNTVPLLLYNHKWVHSLFKDYIINNVNDLKWYCKMYPKIGYAFMNDINENIKKYFPEMILENFIYNIINIFNKM